MTKSTFQPRTNLRRSLQYRPFVRLIYYGNLVPLLFYAVFFGNDLWNKLQDGQSLMAAFQWIQWLALIIWFLLIHFLVRPMMQTTVHVHSLGLTLERPKRKIEISFKDIAQLILPRHFVDEVFLPGFFSVKMTSGHTHYFTIALERSEYVLEAIASQRPDIVDLKMVELFRAKAIVRDHGWAHQKDTFKKSPLKLVLKYVLFPLLQAEAVSILSAVNSDGGPSFLASLIYFIVLDLAIGFMIELLRGYAVMSKGKAALLNNPNAVIRDIAMETKMVRQFEFIYWGLAALALVTFLIYNFSGPR